MFDYKSFIDSLASKGFVVGDEVVGFRVNPYFELPKSLDYNEVAIVQEENQCESRLDADIESQVLRGVWLKCPMIAANMSSVTSADFCGLLTSLGAMGILHRGFSREEDYLEETRRLAEKSQLVAVSVGAGPSQVELASKLFWAGANIINIDIAHGFSKQVIETGRAIKNNHPEVFIIVGNTTNTKLMYLCDDFAAAVKINIGTGAACTTRFTAGAFEKGFSVVDRFRPVSQHLGLPVISDGGISDPSMFVKAIGAGSNSSMMGSIFARCPESAADLVYVDGVPKKQYYGMASLESQIRWRGGLKSGTCAEGKTVYLDLGESAKDLIERYGGALRSGLTYAGARSIQEFHQKAKFVRL